MSEPTTKILLVDDDQDILMLLSFYLQRAGFQIAMAENGEEALQKAARENPHLCIVDRMMPGMDGLEVCRRLRASYPDMFVIMLTAMGTSDDRVTGMEAGADDYIVKPVNHKELVLKIKAMLRRSPHSDHPAKPKPVAPAPVAEQKPSNRVTPSPSDVITPRPAATTPPVPAAPPPAPSGPPTPPNISNAALESTLKAASQAAQSSNITRARELYLHALKLDPTNESALMWLAWYTNDPYEGVRYLERLVEAHPENVKLRDFLHAGKRRIQELDQLVSSSSVLSYWTVAEQMQAERLRNGVDRRTGPVQPVGQLLLKKGYITREQLETAVNLHEMFGRLGTPKKLGEVLLEYGYLTKEQLTSVLNEQQIEYNSQFY